MTQLQNRLAPLAFFSLLCLSSLAQAQTTYDAAANFNSTSHSNTSSNTFVYGTEATLGGTFSAYTKYSPTAFAPFSAPIASFDNTGMFLDVPAVVYNTSNSVYSLHTGGTTITIDPNQLALHPGQNGEYSIVRFNVKTTGYYDISGLFDGADSKPTTTDVHVLYNKKSLFDGEINPTGQVVGGSTDPNATGLRVGGSNTASYALNDVLLTSGKTLDFAVGYGANGNFYYDTTGLNITIKPDGILKGAAVPELSTMLGFGSFLALGGLAAFRKRKQTRCAV